MSDDYAGRIEGKFDVDAHGGATYSMAVTVPPGTAGLQPALQLVYNSHIADLGYAGAGWRLAGLSSITRVPATIATDGFIGRVEYGPSDRFALDGARLVNVEGQYGAADAVYRTEVEQWMKVVPKSSGVAGRSGPDSFTVLAKDGTRTEFGGTEDSRALANSASGKPQNPSVRLWLVNRVTDRNGNFMTIRYDRDTEGNNAYPAAIAYGGNERTGAAAQREVRFSYTTIPADSPDAATQFSGGFGFATTRLLETISTYVDGKLVLTYRLAYARDGITRRSRVTSVTLSDSEGRKLPATTFNWQDGAASFFGSASSVTLGGEVRGSFIPMDVNGDGIVDIVNARADRGQLLLDLYLARPDGTFEQPVSIPVTGLGADAILLPLDIDADGCTDLVHARGERDELMITVFHARQVNGRWTLVQGAAGAGGPKGLRSAAALVSVDYDGDGRIDLVHCCGESGKLVIRPLRSNGTAFTHDAESKTVTDIPWVTGAPLIPVDYDGDGKGDLVYARSDRDQMRVRLLHSDGRRFVPAAEDSDIGNVPFSRILFATDTNGDGKPDLVTARLNAGTLELRTLLSNGLGLERAQLSTFAVKADALPRLLPARLTGGLTDLIVQSLEGDVVKLRVLSSNGAKFVERPGVSQPFTARWLGNTLLPMDVDGDGRTDLLSVGRAGATDNKLTFTAARVAGAIPDLVRRISDGYGEHVSIEYKPLTDSSVYRKTDLAAGANADPRALQLRGVSGTTFDLVRGDATAGAAHSTMSVQFARQVVSAYERPGSGSQRFRFERFYAGARIDLEGRGWLGFATMEIADRSRNTKRVTSYRQDFPFGGSPRRDELRRISDNRLFEEITFEHRARLRGKVHEPQLLKKQRGVFGGPEAAASPDLVETFEFDYDDYGNTTLEAISTSGAPSKPLFTHHTFAGYDLASWNLGMEMELKRTADRAGAEVLNRRKFAYDGRANRKSEEVWDPARERWLSTTYQHDDYGNEVAMTTASGAISRTEYESAYHTFPLRTVQPKNESGIALVTDHQHDPRNGVEIATSQPYVADAGAPRLKAKQEVDGLGRIVKKLGPAPNGELVALKTTTYGRDAVGPFEEESALESWDGAGKVERKYYTPSGSIFQTRALGPDGARETIVERTFDSDGRAIEETLLRYAGTPPRVVRHVYDELGRMVRLERPLANGGTTIAVTKCLSATVEESTEGVGTPAARVTRREYGYFGGKHSVIKRIDALGGETKLDYDALARSTVGIDPNGVVTAAAYDFSDRQISLEVRSGNRVQMSEKTEYDDVTRETVRIDGRGTRIRLRYDAMNRLVRRGPDGGDATVYSYDDASKPNTLSRLATVTSPGGVSAAYDYDAQGNRTLEALTVDGATHETRSSFTPSSRADRTTYPDGSLVRNIHNAAGSLLAVEDGAGARYATYDDFSPFGKPQTVTLLNGTRESLPYNDVGQLVSQTIAGKSGAALASTSIHWNEIYQLSRIADEIDARKTQTFAYDAVGRLLRATGDYDEQLFAYDKAGNLTKKGSIDYAVDGHQVRSGASGGTEVFRAEYDAAGNLKSSERSGERREFRFDAESQLVESGQTTFLYDHEGTRVAKKTAGGAKTYYIGSHFEVTLHADGTRQTTAYIPGAHGLVASKTATEKPATTLLAGVPAPGLYFFHTNHINSTTVQTGANGEEVCRVEYLPFGEIHRITGRDIFRQKFTGNELDYETGLYYFKSRYYDASLGRFISADDRLGGDIDHHDVFNRYAYVLNNPISDFDPEGHASGWAIFAGIAFGVVAVLGVALTIASAGAATPLVATALSSLGGVVASAAASGAMYSFTHMDNFDARRMGIEVGIGAAVGVLGTGVSAIGMKALGVAVEIGVSSAAAITATQVAKMALVETISGFLVGATFAGLQQAADNKKFDLGDVATKAGWGAAGGLVAGAVLGGAVRAAQQPHYRGYSYELFAPDVAFRIPSPSNIYTAKAVQGLVHAPRALFGSLSKMAGAAVS